MDGVHANHVRNGVESLLTFEQNREILQSIVTTFACTLIDVISARDYE